MNASRCPAPRDTISAAIQAAAAKGRPALVGFLTAGFPTRRGFKDNLAAVVRGGRHHRDLRQARSSRSALQGCAAGNAHSTGLGGELGEAHAAYGHLPLKRCLESAVGYARDGFPVTARLAYWRNMARGELAKSPQAAAIFLKHGATLRNADLARTLEAIASDGWYGFYDGEVARELVRYSEANDGLFTLDDLEAQVARWGEPLKGSYRGVTLYETPAPTQGFAVLEMLNLVEPLEMREKAFLGADYVHLMVQAKQIAYHDRDQHLADPRFVDVPMERLISKKYAGERRALMDPARALPWDRIPSYGSLAGDTVYIAAVDRQGNAVSLIHSLYGGFGAAVVAGRTGVVLQNRAAYFSLDPANPNHVEPGKTPLHTLIASLAFRDDKFWVAVGCMGADGQPQIHLQTYVAMIDHGRRHPGSAGGAALPVGPLRHRRGPRHAAHRRAIPGRDDRRTGTARPPRQPLERLARVGRPRSRHHRRSGERIANRRCRSTERRGGYRLLTTTLRPPLKGPSLALGVIAPNPIQQDCHPERGTFGASIIYSVRL